MEKFGFEQPEPAPSEEEVLAAEKAAEIMPVAQKAPGVFERLYKSKFTRALTFAAAVGAGGLFESAREGRESAAVQVRAAETLEKDGLRLESLANKFKAEVQVPGGDKTILHIGQTHAVGNLNGMEAHETTRIIRSQKAIEELLLYLSENKLSNSVYVEGFDVPAVEYFKALESDVKNAPPESLASRTKSLENQQVNFADSTKATWLYLAKLRLEKVIKVLEEKDKSALKNSEESREISSRLASYKAELSEIGSNKLITGDNIYIWGAADKLRMEGKINILPTETREAREKTNAPYTAKEILPTILNAGFKAEFRHREREDVAAKMIAEGEQTSNEKVIPMIYGDAHNFTESVLDLNKNAGHATFGLTKVVPTGE